MNTKKIVIIGLILGLWGALASVFSQNFLDNMYHQQAEALRQQAKTALDNGEYELSIEYSRQSQALSIRAREYALLLYHAFRARAYKTRAEMAIDNADKSNYLTADHKAILEDARGFYRDGVILFDEENYEISTLSFQNVLAVLDAAGLWPDSALAKLAEQVLPQYYKVRLLPQDRDSFSKIAAYPFVYSDYKKWKILYEQNKDKIVDTDNPNLIHPDQLFEIPSIAGEARAGTWDPADGRFSVENAEN